MDTRKRKTCHICGKRNLLQINNHLTQMHGWTSEMKKEYKQKGAGLGENMQSMNSPRNYVQKDAREYTLNDTVFSDDDDESNNGDDNSEEEDMEESDNDGLESITDDDFCFDEESSGIWDKFRREVTKAYKEDWVQKFNELEKRYPNAPSRELKEFVIDQYRDIWVEEAATYLKNIITYYEKFQETSGFFDKIQSMREQLAKTEGEEQALEMAIDLYKRKLGSLFSCGAVEIPE